MRAAGHGRRHHARPLMPAERDEGGSPGERIARNFPGKNAPSRLSSRSVLENASTNLCGLRGTGAWATARGSRTYLENGAGALIRSGRRRGDARRICPARCLAGRPDSLRRDGESAGLTRGNGPRSSYSPCMPVVRPLWPTSRPCVRARRCSTSAWARLRLHIFSGRQPIIRATLRATSSSEATSS